MNISLREMGRRCKEFRIERGYLQVNVANDTGYSVENISSFETGRNDNSRILLWYFEHGMKPDELLERGGKYGKDV